MDRLRRISATAETTDSRHTGIIPSVHQFLFYQSQQITFAHQRIAEVQFIELILVRTVIIQILSFFHPVYKKIVERTVRNEFQRTERMGYAFEVVALSMCEVIHRISFPSGARAMVRMVHYTINDRIAEVHVRIRHVNFGTEHHSTFCYFTCIHLLEQGETFFYWAVAVGTFHTRLGRSTFLLCDLLGSLLVNICFTFFNEADGKVPQLLEVIGRIVFITPLVTQPLNIFLDGFYIFHIFLGRIGIIETQIADAIVVGCNTKIKANSLGVTDVEVSVGFGRETRLHLTTVFTLF